MPSENVVPMYWLMPGDTRLGPHPAEEILQQIQAGSCTWVTKASLVGSQSWVPLNQLLTLAPVAQVAPAHAPVGTPPKPTHAPGWSPVEKSILLGVVLIACWCAWYFFFNDTSSSRLSPQRDVCQKLVDTKNVNEAMKLVTPNMYSATQAVYALPDTSPTDDKLELLDEEPALPQHGGGYYIGYKMHIRDNQQTSVLEGVFHVVNQSGWKVNDWFICKGNGQNVEPPISMAREYMYFIDPQNANQVQRTNTDSKQKVKQWYDDKNVVRAGGYFLGRPGVGKGIVLVIGAIAMGIYGLFSQRSSTTNKT